MKESVQVVPGIVNRWGDLKSGQILLQNGKQAIIYLFS